MESNNIRKCLGHYLETDEIEPLWAAIELQETEIENAVSMVVDRILMYRKAGVDSVANELTIIRGVIKSLNGL